MIRKARFSWVACRKLIWFLMLLMAVHAKGQEFLIEEDLRLDWTFYDSDGKTLLPFLSGSTNSPHAIHLTCDLNKGKAAYLRIDIPDATSLLIENKYMEYIPMKASKLFSLDSLKKIYASDNIIITLFNSARFPEPVVAAVGYKFRRPETSQNVNPMQWREFDSNADYFKIVLLIVFAFFVLLYSAFPAEMLEFYSINSVIAYRFTDTQLTRFRSVTKIQTLIIVFQSAVMAAVMIMALHYFRNPLGNVFFLRWNALTGWLALFIITLVSLWLKYFLILFFSLLFDVFERANLYFLEYNRITTLFYSIIFLVLSYSFINFQYRIPYLIGWLSVLVFGFYFVRMTILYFKLRRVTSIHNLHLISYLCAIELVPIVIGLNFFLR